MNKRARRTLGESGDLATRLERERARREEVERRTIVGGQELLRVEDRDADVDRVVVGRVGRVVVNGGEVELRRLDRRRAERERGGVRRREIGRAHV